MQAITVTFFMIALSTLAVQTQPARAEGQTDLVAETARFEFHSNAWLNLHHYLYNLAKDDRAEELNAHLSELALSDEEAAALADAVKFYRAKYANNSLLFNRDLYALKRLLISADENDDIALDDYPETERHLRRARPIYDKHFWPAHRRANQRILDDNLTLASDLEGCVFDRIGELSQNQWPERKVRVDQSYVANWAGAYTTVNPIVHAVIRSSGWKSRYDWIEILFHEPTHAMIAPDAGTVADTIKQVSGHLGKKPPGGLWHAILFYVAGTAVKECLAEEGIDYEMFMFREGVFSKFHDGLRRHMPDYVAGEIPLERAVENMLAENGH